MNLALDLTGVCTVTDSTTVVPDRRAACALQGNVGIETASLNGSGRLGPVFLRMLSPSVRHADDQSKCCAEVNYGLALKKVFLTRVDSALFYCRATLLAGSRTS